MNIKEGDKVRFLNDVGGGIVVKIIDRFSVLITNEEGFDIPVDVSELIVVEEGESYDSSTVGDGDNNATQNEIVGGEDIDMQAIFCPDVEFDESNGDDINIYYAFVPQGVAGNSDLDLYLINNSNYNILYSVVDTGDSKKYFLNAVGVIEANTKEQIGTLGFNSINLVSEYIFHIIFYKKGEFNIKSPIEKSIKINPVKFYKEKSYKENDFFNEDALLFTVVSESALLKELENITDSEFREIVKTKEKQEEIKKHKSPKSIEKNVLEVDLHIHELLDDFRGLSDKDMLDIQMGRFKQELSDAKKNRVKKIVFIHGVGTGTLKHSIRRELDKNKNKYTYQDASYKEYGYGATMVYVK